MLTSTYGDSADLLTWSSSLVSPSLIVIFICGNPGLPSYYLHFLSTLSRSLPSAAVYGLGHLNHSPTTSTVQHKQVTLQDQVDHKVAFLDDLNRQYSMQQNKINVLLIGHSVGSWIACEVCIHHPV